MKQIALALILGLGATIARADQYGIFFNDNFPAGDPLAQRDEWALLHQGKAVNATDLAPRYKWRWVYYFKALERRSRAAGDKPERRFVGGPGARFRQGGRAALPRSNRKFLPSAGCLDRREKNRSRDLIGLTESFCLSTLHSADRGEGKFGRAGDIRSFQFHRPPARGAAFEKACRVGAGAARAAFARNENALRHRRGNF